ncbi:MAG: hypothetical protein HC924_17495 [Synechococcaceae cyanobacterium SM2_3_2]|nr:hypothetical protein [Synechococcaceae cyanobacterium SM2_3_2]
MTVAVESIFDGTTTAGTPFLTALFKDVELLIFQAVGIPANEGYEFGASIMIRVPDPTGAFLWKEIRIPDSFLDTAFVYRIPSEFSLGLDMRVVVDVGEEFALQVWGIRSNLACDLELICERVNDISVKLNILLINELAGLIGKLLPVLFALATGGGSLLLPSAVPILLEAVLGGEVIDVVGTQVEDLLLLSGGF